MKSRGSILRWFSSHRHAGGFGIHSPFGYRFVKEALCTRSRYYNLIKLPDRNDRFQRTLFRIFVYFDLPLEASGESGSVHKTIHRLACGDHPRREGRMVCVSAGGVLPEGIEQAVKEGDTPVVVIFSDIRDERLRAMRDRLWGMARHAMMFQNLKSQCVFVSMHCLSKQCLNVAF